jgi:hypothetical protein
MRSPAAHTLAVALAAVCVASAVGLAQTAQAPIDRPILSGTWSLNKSLGTAPGSGGMPDDGPPERPVGGRGPGGGGGGMGGPGGGGGGGRFPMRGGGGSGPPDRARREGDMASRRALMVELMELPPKVTIAQDGDKVVFIEPDGVVRTYVANDKDEKHQLQNGTIETRSKWDDGALVMVLKVGKRAPEITRRFKIKGDPRQLEVTTTFDGGPRDAKRIAVYEHVDDAHPAAQ